MKKKDSVSIKDLVVLTRDVVPQRGESASDMDSVENYVTDIEKHESSAMERRVALRKISSAMLRRLLRRIEIDGDTGGLMPVDMVLRYMRFVLDLDTVERSPTEEVDPIEFLEKITGLPKEMIVSLYHTSSLEKFREVTSAKEDAEEEDAS